VARVTAAQLLSHTAGLRAEAPPDDGLHDDTALGDNIRQWKEDVFFTEPGKIFSYSNPGYWLAGLLAGTTERQYFADVLANRVFEPLGMTHSTFRPTMAMTFPLAIGHEPDGENVPHVRRPFADNVAGWPSGQMFSNVHDLGRWCIALLNGGQLDGEQVLSASLIHELTTPHADMPGLDSKYGYGLQLDTWHGGRHWYHNGGRAGFGSFIRLAPDHKAAVILLMNVTMAAMPKTAEKALELAASLNPPPAPEMSSVLPGLTSKREPPSVPLTQCAGRYRNGALSEELIARGDKLLRRHGTKEEELTAVVQIPFVTLTGQAEPLLVMTVNGKPEYFLVVGESGKPEFIFRGDIALARQSE
jgi:CubicO group peptidase (beta-lactamase class C family)